MRRRASKMGVVCPRAVQSYKHCGFHTFCKCLRKFPINMFVCVWWCPVRLRNAFTLNADRIFNSFNQKTKWKWWCNHVHDPNDSHSLSSQKQTNEIVTEMKRKIANKINRMIWPSSPSSSSSSPTRFIKTWCNQNPLTTRNECVQRLVNGHSEFVLFALHGE